MLLLLARSIIVFANKSLRWKLQAYCTLAPRATNQLSISNYLHTGKQITTAAEIILSVILLTLTVSPALL